MEDYQIQRFTHFHNTILQNPDKYPHLNSLINHFQNKTPIYVARQLKRQLHYEHVLISEGVWALRSRLCMNEAIRVLFPNVDFTEKRLKEQPIEYHLLARIVSPQAFPKHHYEI